VLDPLLRPAGELAALVRDGEVSARELTERALERIEALDPGLCAFTHVDAERAFAAATAIGPGDPRPFAGVPTAIKDNRLVEGMPVTLGATLTGDFRAPADQFLVRRLREAGFVLLGKTSLPEFGILPTTEPTRFGPARNPWDRERTPGGSSGGAAAAVAAGLVPVAHGNDGGGSIRIPAACCGLVGLKPARGRVSLGPVEGASFLVQDGMLTRTVADSAALLDVLAGYEAGDAWWAPPPPAPFAALAARDPGRRRIALTTTPPLPDLTVEPECLRVVHEAAELLAELGHAVEEIEAPWTQPGLLDLFAASFGPSVAFSIELAAQLRGSEPRQDELEPLSWRLLERARELPSSTFLLLEMQLQALARHVIATLAPYDALLTPALAQRPVPIGTLSGALPDADDTFRRSGHFAPFTAIANVSGQPAIALPLGHGGDGLPSAIQLLGRPADEGTLLALAAQLETARPWADRRPSNL
jgi:amidase